MKLFKFFKIVFLFLIAIGLFSNFSDDVNAHPFHEFYGYLYDYPELIEKSAAICFGAGKCVLHRTNVLGFVGFPDNKIYPTPNLIFDYSFLKDIRNGRRYYYY